jgi:hypothetical protein
MYPLTRSRQIAALCCIALLGLGLAACKQQGPVERVGEEVDEAVDTAKHGGKESLTTKADDAVDDLREGAEDAAHDLKEK